MATINVTSDSGTTATVVTATPVTFSVSGGLIGPRGDDGHDGVGVPAGGSIGQVLTKTSGADYDDGWQTPIVTPDATASVKGKLQLTGDLGGTAASPQIKRTNRFVVAPFGDTRPADYTCADATGNEIEINQAIVAANALTNGGTVELLDGDFVLSDSVVPLNNVHLHGQGMFKTRIISVSNGTFSLFDNQSVYSVSLPWTNGEISDLELDGSNFAVNTGSKGLDGHGMVNVKIHHLYVHDTTASGLGFDYPYAVTITENIVMRCGFIGKRVISAASWSASVISITTASAHGYTGSVKATGLLTASAIANNDTVTLGAVTYTFKTVLTGAAYEVLINGSVANALTNLKAAINLTGVIGTDYGTGTLIHQLITGGTLTATTLVLTAKNFGTGGNALATTTTGAGISFGAATLTGGTTGNRVVIAGMLPLAYNGIYNVSTVIDATHFTIDASLNNSGTLQLGFDPGTATQFGSSSDFNIGHNGIGIASGGLTEENVVVTNNVCIGNQNNNILIETDFAFTGEDGGYTFANNISLYGGTCGYRNTGARNTKFVNNYDFGSLVGAHIAGFPVAKTPNAASWLAGVATFTTSSAHGYSIGTKVGISGMLTTTYNGYYTVLSVPTTTTFTVAIASDPGTAVFDPNSPTVKATTIKEPTEGTLINHNTFSNNAQYGIQVDQYCDNYSLVGNNIQDSGHYGIYSQSGNAHINQNKIYGGGRTGISIVAGGTYWPLDTIDILHNHIYNNGILTTGDGIIIDSTTSTPIKNVNIVGNHCFDNQATATQRYGIIITSGGSNQSIFVAGNTNYGNTTSNIFIQDTSNSIVCYNNIGTNPIGRISLGNITGAVTFDSSTGNFFKATLTGNITATMPASAVDGTIMTWVLLQDGTGSRTLTLPGNTSTSAGGLTLSTTANVVDTITWIYDAVSTKWREVSRSLNRRLSISEGGTGQSTATAAFNALSPMTTAGDLIYGGASGAGTRLAAGSSTQVLIGGTTPAWSSVVLTTMVSGILPSANGGTANGFTKFSGPTTSEKTFTLPDASSTIVVQGGALGTPSSGTLTNATGLPVAGITSSTSTALGVGTLELGHATDTTLSRSAAGQLAVEGVDVLTTSNTKTSTNKRFTPRVTSTASSATPTINTDNTDAVDITALAADITSMTTSLSGTPTNFDKLIIRIKDNGTSRAITWGHRLRVSVLHYQQPPLLVSARPLA